MKIQKSKPDVFTSNEPVIAVSREFIRMLKEEARRSPRQRARFCAHPDNGNLIHEMLIVLAHDTYVCPHRHPAKSESFHVIEGTADVVIFDETGNITNVIHLGDCHSSRPFYYRISNPYFHTVVVHSDCFVIHETTNGPFRARDCVFASWAPHENQPDAAVKYMDRLRQLVKENASNLHKD